MGKIIEAILRVVRAPFVMFKSFSHYTYFTFQGWNDEQKKAAADGGNLDYLDQEIASGRRGPAHPHGIITIDTSASYRAEKGDRIIVHVYDGEITDDQIIAYLAELGVDATKE